MGRSQEGSIFKKTPDATKWTVAFVHPHSNKRFVRTLYTDYRASLHRLQEMIIEAERETEGLGDRFKDHRQRHISEHIGEYLEHCEHVGEARVHRGNKKSQLERLIAATGATRLADLDPNKVERHLQALSKSGRIKKHDKSPDKGLSARSVNQHRATAVAFLEWCVATSRMADNPLKIVPVLDERKDRRRIRRALSVEELAGLANVTEHYRPVYIIAAYTGLRRGELRKITWADLDLDAAHLRVRVGVGKAAREDYVPLHPEAHAEFARLKVAARSSRGLIFESLPGHRTVAAHLKRAGIASPDADGRTVDFHSLRTTFGTLLARSGVMPQEAMRAMRHSDVKITMKHYTDLRTHDISRAVGKLPSLPKGEPEKVAARATGTEGRPAETPEAGPLPGPFVVAPLVAQPPHNHANPFGSMHTDGNGQPKLKLAGRSGEPTQSRYTSPLSTPVHRGAKGKGAGNRKPLQDSLLGAISAVG